MRTLNNWRWREVAVEPGPAVVFDIDGVLSNASQRQHFITCEQKDWHGFFRACGGDSVIEETARLLSLLREELAVILLTGRPLDVQDITADWFERHGLRWDLLIMRDRGDYAASIDFKQQTIRRLKATGFDLQLAFEDDSLNRDMFESEGVPCMYVHSGYYEQRDALRRAQ